MKKLLAIALIGVLAAAALAVESDPSNTVGFVSQTVPDGNSAFGICPQGLEVDKSVGLILGGQGTDGDKIYEMVAGAWVTWTKTAGSWGALLMSYNEGFLYNNDTGADQSLVVAGDVVAEGTVVDMGDFPAGQNVMWGNPLPIDIDLDTDDLGLGFQNGDKIYDMAGGAWVTWTYDGFTYGLDLLIGEGYLFKVDAANPAIDWNYTVGSAPAAVQNDVRKVAKAASAASVR